MKIMGEQEKEKKKSSVSTLIATIIVALAAVAAIVVLIVMTGRAPEEEQRLPDGTEVTFKPTQELADECGERAQELMQGNYRVLRLFISEGLPHRSEPYGNRPEDGLYTVDSAEFRTFEQVEELVRSVYTEDEAERILTGMPSDASGSGRLIAVYAPREIYVDRSELLENTSVPKVPEVVIPSTESGPTYVKTSVLGISEDFTPYTDYKKPWGSISIKIVPVSADECYVTVYLGAAKDVDLSSIEETDILNTKMVRVNGEWRLTELVY